MGKLYGRVLIERAKELTGDFIGEEQGGFRQGRGCIDQAFTLRLIAERYLEKRRDLFVCFMDLEKAYDRVCTKKLWLVMEEYGVKGNLLKGIKAFYLNSRACVRVKRDLSVFFDVRVGLRQGCVMSPWLFNIFMDSTIREMDRVGKGAHLMLEGRIWDVSVLLFADDAVLIADSEDNLGSLVQEFDRVCEVNKLKINPGKSKVMVVRSEVGEMDINRRVWGGIQLRGVDLERVSVFRYLGMDFGERGGMEEEIKHRISEGKKVLGALKGIWKRGGLSREIKVRLFEVICLSTVLYGCETWVLNAKVRKRLEVLEMDGLRGVCSLRRIDRVRNERIKQLCKWTRSVVARGEQGVLRWFGHVVRMSDERLVKKVFDSTVGGFRGRGRPKWRWLDGVRLALGNRGLNLEDGMRVAEDRDEWRRVVDM